MKKILFFFIFILGAYMLFFTNFKERFGETSKNDGFYDTFNTLERENWFVGEWSTHEAAFGSVFLEDGVAKLPITISDKGPYLLSKSFPVEGYEVVKIKRRVKLSPGEKYFSGGMALFETNSENMRPDVQAAMPFGNALFLIEYANGTYGASTRPGDSTFRILTPGWQTNGNFLLVDPQFDVWITEEITYNFLDGSVSYTLNGKE